MIELMTPQLWEAMRHFRPDSKLDKWGDPFKISSRLIFALDNLREYVGKPIYVHCAWEPRDKGGWHPSGNAVDVHIKGLHVVDQFLVASKFDSFNGIGVYPWWRSPGLHLDDRPHSTELQEDSRWGSTKAGVYVALSWKFLKGLK